MKKFILIIAIVLGISLIGKTQDFVHKLSGDEVKVKITEITIDGHIKYKDWDNLTGPTKSFLRSEVYMIVYENGKTEKFGANQPEQKGANSSTQLQQSPQSVPNKGKFLLTSGFHLLLPFDEDISEALGSMFGFSLGIGVDLEDIFLLGRLNTATKNYEENLKFNWTQFDGEVGLKWGGESSRATVYSGMGLAYISLADKGYGASVTANGVGLILDLGVDIPLNKTGSTILYFSSMSTFGQVEFYGEKLSASSEKLNFGLKFKL